MGKKEFLVLLDKYLAGNASNEEEQFLFDVYQRMEDKYEWSLSEMETLDQLEHRLIERFKTAIHQSSEVDQSKEFKTPWSYFNRNSIYHAAAILLVFVSIGAAYWVYQSPSSRISRLFVDNSFKNLVTHVNNTRETEKLIFPDSSSVNLSAGSKVMYARDFSGSLRQVYLEGEGFFQVTKNHTKPFIVYTDKVVAKVLGTSFIVKSGLNNTEASVLVKTGKVSVFKTKDFTKEDAKPNLTDGIILLPNHVADLNPKEELEKKLPLAPEILKPRTIEKFDFDNTPIDTVFSRLQDTYGIAIVYNKVKLGSCSLSVNMGKEDFYQKLDLICRTINASYEVRDGNVVVYGQGCGISQ